MCLNGSLFNRYIVKEKITNPDGVVFSYKLAENALDEIGKENIQAYVKQVGTYGMLTCSIG